MRTWKCGKQLVFRSSFRELAAQPPDRQRGELPAALPRSLHRTSPRRREREGHIGRSAIADWTPTHSDPGAHIGPWESLPRRGVRRPSGTNERGGSTGSLTPLLPGQRPNPIVAVGRAKRRPRLTSFCEYALEAQAKPLQPVGQPRRTRSQTRLLKQRATKLTKINRSHSCRVEGHDLAPTTRRQTRALAG